MSNENDQASYYFTECLRVLAVLEEERGKAPRPDQWKGMRKSEIAPRVIIDRPPSRFAIPESTLGRVLGILRAACHVDRVGARYKLAFGYKRLELPPPLEGFTRDREGKIVITNEWSGNGGRVHLYLKEAAPLSMKDEIWTAYIPRELDPRSFGRPTRMSRALSLGFQTRSSSPMNVGPGGFYAGTTLDRAYELARFYRDTTYERVPS